MKKSLNIILLLSLIVLLCVSFASCSDTGSTQVSLYVGDNLFKTVDVTIGEEYDFGVAQKTGYSFLGWYSAETNGSAYTDALGKSAGMVWKETDTPEAYALFEANKYKLFLDYCEANAQNSISEISVTYDAEISEKMPVPLKSGFSFKGWFTAKENGVQITDSAGNFLDNTKIYNESVYPLGEGGTKLYAQWGGKSVTYTFSTGDGTAVESIKYPVGTVINQLPSSLKDNHCFVSWCFDSTMLLPMEFPYTIPDSSEEHVTLYANFVAGTVDVLQFSTISSTGDKEYEVTYSGDAEKIVIPDSYYGKKITRIKKIQSSTVKEVILPQTITTIINGAFENCIALEKVKIPFAVKNIPEKCFSHCASLKSIYIPQNVTAIGKEAFSGCSSINEISLSKNIETVGNGAFRNMSALEKFVVEEGNEKYTSQSDVLYYKVGTSLYLVQYPAEKEGSTYQINESTVKIMEYAFSSSKLSTITISGKITSIEKGAFENCKNLVSVSISGTMASFSIDADAFLNCSNLKAMKIELTKVPTLNETSFSGVSDAFSVYVTSDMIRTYQTSTNWRQISDKIYSLGTIFGDFAIEEVENGYTIRQYFGTAKEVEIPEILNAHKIVEISPNAFSMSGVEKVIVPKDVTKIGDGAFANCTSLKSIVMECTPPTLGNDVFVNAHETFGIYINNTTAVLDAYRSAEKWSDLADKIWSINN